MVRVGGLSYTCSPGQTMGRRITEMRLGGKLIDADRKYKVAGWAPVAEPARTATGNRPVWDVVEDWLRSQPGGHVTPRRINTPTLVGVQDNAGISKD